MQAFGAMAGSREEIGQRRPTPIRFWIGLLEDRFRSFRPTGQHESRLSRFPDAFRRFLHFNDMKPIIARCSSIVRLARRLDLDVDTMSGNVGLKKSIIPEPGTGVLVGMGLTIATTARRRRAIFTSFRAI